MAMNTKYIASIMEKYPPLSYEEERKLIKDHKNNPEELAQLLALHNSGLINLYGETYRGLMDDDDIVSAGLDGLYRAALKFKPEKRIKFSTFGGYGIKHELRNRLYHWNDKVRKHSISFDINTKTRDDSGKPSSDSFADFLVSKANPVYNLPTDNFENYLERDSFEELKNTIRGLTYDLDKRDISIIFDYIDLESYELVGKKYGISRQRVCEIVKRVKRKLQSRGVRKILKSS